MRVIGLCPVLSTDGILVSTVLGMLVTGVQVCLRTTSNQLLLPCPHTAPAAVASYAYDENCLQQYNCVVCYANFESLTVSCQSSNGRYSIFGGSGFIHY